MVIYDNKPTPITDNNNGSFTYHWNITPVEIDGMEKWECEEVIMWGEPTRHKVTEAVITYYWAPDYEKKLINDYNAAKEGILSDDGYTERYRDFLNRRKEIKTLIEQDF